MQAVPTVDQFLLYLQSPESEYTVIRDMLNEYTGVRHISKLVDPLLLSLASGIVNKKGQVYIFDSGVDINPFLERPVYFVNARRGGVQALGELVFGERGRSR